MNPARVIPCLLLSGDRLVKTTRFSDSVYVGDPVNVLSQFNAFEVDEVFLLDIRAAVDRSPTPAIKLRRFAEECFIPLAYGGGLSSMDQIESVFASGFEKVVIGTAALERPHLLSEAAGMFGSQAVVAAIDVSNDGTRPRVMAHGGTVATTYDPVGWARQVEALGAGEVLLTAIDREGTMEGYDADLTESVSSAVGIPVVAHGGAGRRKDLVVPLQRGASAVAAGSLFVYQGSSRGVLINYPTRTQLARLTEH